MRPPSSVFLRIDGLISVHAVRAAYTALAAVPGVVRAEVSRRGALIEHDGSATRASVADALAMAGLALAEWRDERPTLPVVEDRETR